MAAAALVESARRSSSTSTDGLPATAIVERGKPPPSAEGSCALQPRELGLRRFDIVFLPEATSAVCIIWRILAGAFLREDVSRALLQGRRVSSSAGRDRVARGVLDATSLFMRRARVVDTGVLLRRRRMRRQARPSEAASARALSAASRQGMDEAAVTFGGGSAQRHEQIAARPGDPRGLRLLCKRRRAPGTASDARTRAGVGATAVARSAVSSRSARRPRPYGILTRRGKSAQRAPAHRCSRPRLGGIISTTLTAPGCTPSMRRGRPTRSRLPTRAQ